MNGVATIRALLVADAAVTSLVPGTRISAGDLPQDTALPAISIDLISSVDRNITAQGATRHVTDRVQVTVLASTYASQKSVQEVVKKACADKFPTVSGISSVVVHTDSQGPDMRDETNSIRMGVQDFRVSYTQNT